MNPRLGACLAAACAAITFFAAGCNNSTTTTTTATPAPVTTGPDTLYVQDGGSKTIRAYAHASSLNGVAYATALYPTSDPSNPDIVYYEPYNILWFASAYPNATYTGVESTPVRIWYGASAANGANPTALTPYADGSGAVTYDSTHDLLFVGNVDGPTIQVFATAHLMTNVSLPAANVTLSITDPGVVGSPRAQVMLYDPVHDRLFVSDEGTVVAVFDNFGSTALSGGTRTANRQMIGFDSPDGLAYSPVNDVLYVGEVSRKQMSIIHNASTANGPTGHTQVVNGFLTGPNGLAYDDVHDLLYIFDPSYVWTLPGPAVASGDVNTIVNRHQFYDSTVNLYGFGLSVDTVH